MCLCCQRGTLHNSSQDICAFVCRCGRVCVPAASIPYRHPTYKTHGWSACLLCGFANNAYPLAQTSESFRMVKPTYGLNLCVFNHNLYFHFASGSLLVRKNSKTSRLFNAQIKHSCKVFFGRYWTVECRKENLIFLQNTYEFCNCITLDDLGDLTLFTFTLFFFFWLGNHFG